MRHYFLLLTALCFLTQCKSPDDSPFFNVLDMQGPDYGYHIGRPLVSPSKPLKNTAFNIKTGLHIVAHPKQRAKLQTQTHMKIQIINQTKAAISIRALDGRPYMIQEALDVDGQWKAIEFRPLPSCANCRYTPIVIHAASYIDLEAPKYIGEFKTKIRFKLILNGKSNDPYDVKVIRSKAFDGSINLSQFIKTPNAWRGYLDYEGDWVKSLKRSGLPKSFIIKTLIKKFDMPSQEAKSLVLDIMKDKK